MSWFGTIVFKIYYIWSLFVFEFDASNGANTRLPILFVAGKGGGHCLWHTLEIFPL